jgi:hypothetical protein
MSSEETVKIMFTSEEFAVTHGMYINTTIEEMSVSKTTYL